MASYSFVSDNDVDMIGGQSCCPNTLAALFVGVPTTVIFTDDIDAPTWQYTLSLVCGEGTFWFVYDVDNNFVGSIGSGCFFTTYTIFVIDPDLNSLYGSGWACGAVPIDPPPDDIFVWFGANTTTGCNDGIAEAHIHCANDFDLPDPPT